MSMNISIGFPSSGTSFARSSRKSSRANRKYRKATLQAEIDAQAYHRTAWSKA